MAFLITHCSKNIEKNSSEKSPSANINHEGRFRQLQESMRKVETQIPSELNYKISKSQGDREGMIPAQSKHKQAILDNSYLEIKETC